MPNFKCAENELKTRLDKWLYFIKHLEDFQVIPNIFTDDVFSQAFDTAELSKFGKTELAHYENSLKVYRDLKGVIDTAFDEGKMEGKIEMARFLKELGVPIDAIMKSSGLTKSEIEKL